MSSATYELAIIGFQCTNPTRDDALEFDGKGDEVYFSVNTKIVAEDGSVPYNGNVTSAIMGDTNGFPTRVNVGSKSVLGGIQGGDRYPNPLSGAFAGGGQQNYPPYVIWGWNPCAE